MAKDDGKAMKEAAQGASGGLAKIAKQLDKATKFCNALVKTPASDADDLMTSLEDLMSMVDDEVKDAMKDLKAASK